MSVINLQSKQAQKRAEELKGFLLELDSVCDILYKRLDYFGVWESLLSLEDVRIRYYLEYYECTQIANNKEGK